MTLLAVLALLVVVILAVAASSVRADETGLQIRNGLRTYRCRGAGYTRSSFRRGDPWAQLLLTPADGGEFAVDLDAEKCQLMAIQAVDGARAQQAVDELRRRLQQYRALT